VLASIPSPAGTGVHLGSPAPVAVARARSVPPRTLSQGERGAALRHLHDERFVDCSPARVYATVLDEGPTSPQSARCTGCWPQHDAQQAVYFVASAFVARLNRTWHVERLLTRAGKGGPVVAGAAFAIAWTPCVGPILSAAAHRGRGARRRVAGVLLGRTGDPVSGDPLAFGRMTSAFDVVKRHFPIVIGVSGAILITVGVLTWTGELFVLNINAQQLLKPPRH